MVTLTEGKHEGEFIGELAMGIGFHVDAITLKELEDLNAGAVLGAVETGDGDETAKKFVEWDPTATDGSQIVAAILMKNTDASAADVATTALTRGPAVVNANDLEWFTGAAAADIAKGKAQLLDLGIKAA